MKELNARLKSGRIDRVYIFYGSEPYLIRAYEKRLRAAALNGTDDMNAVLFQSDALPLDIAAAIQTPPFLSNYRLVIIKDGGFLQTGKKDAAEAMAELVQKIPETTAVLFLETVKPPDKRSKLYKRIAESGLVVDFATPSEAELINWLTKLFQSEDIALSKQAAQTMLRRIGTAEGIMDVLHSESMKLISYLNGRKEASVADVEAVCSQSVEGRVFDLVKELGNKDIKALSSFEALLSMKEQPLGILSMITRQFRLILICQGLREQGLNNAEVARRAGIRDFMAADFLRQAGNYTSDALCNAMAGCLEAEYSVKTGRMTDKLALETLIIKQCKL